MGQDWPYPDLLARKALPSRLVCWLEMFAIPSFDQLLRAQHVSKQSLMLHESEPQGAGTDAKEAC